MTGFIVANIEDFTISFKKYNAIQHLPDSQGVATACGKYFEGRKVWLADPEGMGEGNYDYFAECGILCKNCWKSGR